ncbi:MAG: type IV pilus assembly protein PilM [Minisyncoccia bacterium]
MAFLSGIFGNKQKGASVLGVDIGSSSLKVVQLRQEAGKAVLETYGELALGPYAGKAVGLATELPADTIAATLKDLVREASVTTKECGVSIPFARSLLTLVTLPRGKNKAEEKTIIELEARKYIPVPINEVQLDWFSVPDERKEKDDGKSEVLLVAVHNDELKLLDAAVKGADLHPHFFEIEIFSTVRAVVDEPVKPVMVLDIGAATTKAYVVEHGVVALSHTIPHGGQDATRAIATESSVPLARAEQLKKEGGLADGPAVKQPLELVFSSIFAEAKRAFLQYESHRGRAIANVVLTGGGGVTKALGAYAQTLFAVPVAIADPFGKTEAPAFMRPVLEAIGPEFAVAVGIALRMLGESR